jgi:hypothetical protein
MDPEVLREYLFKEIELSQNIINRMGNNSFLVKGAAVTLISTSLLIEGKLQFTIAAFLPWLALWYLDAYFLRVERLYRKLDAWLIANRLNSEEFLLDSDRKSLETRFGKDVDSVPRTMFSRTLMIFYGLLLAMIIISVLINVFS